MTDRRDVWSRLREARVVRILLVYLGASWVVLQAAQIIVEAFKLPDWVLPTTIILLTIGLVVVGATAWVQALASTKAGEDAGELPTDWQIAPMDAITSLRHGRIPHLTWGRALAGGGAALILLFAGAGSYAGMTRLHLIGANPVSAAEAATGIAIVPFDVRGTDMEIWREGMMDVLSHGLDGVGGFRAIDSRTVLARWHDRVGDKPADQAATLDVARETGARYALEGSVIALGTSVRLMAVVYDLENGKEVARGQVEGAPANMLQLADELAVSTLRSLLSSAGNAAAAAEMAETISTKSLPAMRAYLEGAQHYRKGEFAAAVQSYEQAVAQDSTFAIALVELSEAYGWLESDNSARMKEVGKRAFAHADRLSPRYQFIMTGWDALNRHSPDGVASLREAVRKYPDDARAWFLLAETYIHVGGSTYATDDEVREALQKATSLDPGFAPYLIHVAEYEVLHGDRAGAEKTVERYITMTHDSAAVEHIQLAIPLLLGSDQEVAATLARLPKYSQRALDLYGAFAQHDDYFDRDAAVDAALGAVTHTNRVPFQAYYAGGRGALAEGSRIADRPEVSAEARASYHAYAYLLWDVVPPAGTVTSSSCSKSAICQILVAEALAGLKRWPEFDRLQAAVRAAANTTKDTAAARAIATTADIINAVGLHRRGNLDAARTPLTRLALEPGFTGQNARYELALVEAESKHPAEALRQFDSIRDGFMRPVALYGAAAMHEQLGQTQEARDDWARFVKLTENGDALERIASARAALARLGPKD